jgi:hypothetical protein
MKRSYFNYTGITISYGVTKRLTAEAELGYFINKTRIYELPLSTIKQRGYGLSNGYITAKYGALIKPLKKIELTVGAGFKFPFSTEPLYVDNVRLPIDLQPSTQSYGAMGLLIFSKDFPKISLRLLSLNRFEYNFPGKTDYKYGSSLSNSVFLSKKIVRNLFGIFMVRNEYKMPDMNAVAQEINTGSNVTFLSAQLSYSLLGKWHIAGLFDYPLYKYYIGTQLSPKYSFAFSLTRDLNLNKKVKEPSAAGRNK